jgi:hypothetical protein
MPCLAVVDVRGRDATCPPVRSVYVVENSAATNDATAAGSPASYAAQHSRRHRDRSWDGRAARKRIDREARVAGDPSGGNEGGPVQAPRKRTACIATAATIGIVRLSSIT